MAAIAAGLLTARGLVERSWSSLPSGFDTDEPALSLRHQADESQQADDVAREVLRGGLSDAQVPLSPGYQKLDREPAGLPPYPQNARLERRYQMAGAGLIDELAFWRVRADAGQSMPELSAAIINHYEAAASRAGFVPWDSADSPQPGQGAVATRHFGSAADDTALLTLRLQRRDAELHVMVWLRYAM